MILLYRLFSLSVADLLCVLCRAARGRDGGTSGRGQGGRRCRASRRGKLAPPRPVALSFIWRVRACTGVGAAAAARPERPGPSSLARRPVASRPAGGRREAADGGPPQRPAPGPPADCCERRPNYQCPAPGHRRRPTPGPATSGAHHRPERETAAGSALPLFCAVLPVCTILVAARFRFVAGCVAFNLNHQ